MSTSKNQQDFPHAKPTLRTGSQLLGGAPHDADERGLLGVDISAGAVPPPFASADSLRARLRRMERDESEPRTTLLPMAPPPPPRSMPAPPKAVRPRSWGPTKLLLAFLFGGLSGGSVYSLAEHAHAQQPAQDGIESRALAATSGDALLKPEAAPPPMAAGEGAHARDAAKDKQEDPAIDFTLTASDARHAAERSLLRAARAQLHAGEPFSAQVTLQRLQQRFPRGKWAQKREALAIEVQNVVGQPTAAKRAARAFAEAHPYSPHMAPLKPLLLDE
jgi:hypothetical protein